MKEKIIKNLGNIGLLVFSAGIWVDVLFDIVPEGWVFSVPSMVLVGLGLITLAVHFVMRARTKKSAKAEEKSKGSGEKDEN
jgi:hypothetical protein